MINDSYEVRILKKYPSDRMLIHEIVKNEREI